MGLIIQDKLNEIEILMPKVDVVFIPDIHPDGLLLHYSTTYKYNSELEDFFLSNNCSRHSHPDTQPFFNRTLSRN